MFAVQVHKVGIEIEQTSKEDFEYDELKTTALKHPAYIYSCSKQFFALSTKTNNYRLA
jgi:hypothetical protein